MKYDFLTKIECHAKSRPHHQALVSNEKTLSYADLYHLVGNCIQILQRKNIGEQSVVGLSIPDEILHLITTLSLFAIGAKQITLASFDSLYLRTTIAKQVGVTHVISTDKKNTLENRNLLLLSNDMILNAGRPTEYLPGKRSFDNEEQLYLKTSGTTGNITIVGSSQCQLALQSQRHAPFNNERFLKLNSNEHNNTKRLHLYCLYQGGTCVIRGTSSEPLSRFCRQHNITWLELTRIHLADLARNFSKQGNRFFSKTKIIATGSSVPHKLRYSIHQKVTDKLYIRYACTEFGSISIFSLQDDPSAESVGRPSSGVVIEIVGDDDSKLPYGSIGKVRIMGPGMATHYVENKEKSALHFRNGWFYPGDMGCLKDDGTLTLHGRQDDMMIMNSLNIFPSEIERVLEQHPSIRIASAVGLPSEVHGQIPVAAVELNEHTHTTASDLKAYARERLALKAPRKILILKSLPYSLHGKVARQELIEIFTKEDV